MADALPAGRAWSAVIDTLKLQGHTIGIQPRRIEADALGRPLAFVEALGGIGQDMYVLRWEDSTWTSVDHLGYGTKGVRPVSSPSGTHHLIWSGLEEIDPLVQSYLVMNEFAGDTLSRPDTVTTIYAGSLVYAAAAGPVRRWAAASDNFEVRLLYSDALGVWIEVPVSEGQGDRGVAVAVLDDTTALMVWRDLFLGPGAGILHGSSWALIADPPLTGLNDAAPRFRPRPSGGHWLSWATIDDHVGIASYRDGVWSPPESVFCAYLRPEAHRSQSTVDMSRDEGEYPAISWMAVSTVNSLTSVCVCVPSDSGFTIAENLPGSEDGISPVVARDRNQDVWVVWNAPSGMAWAHTYTRATSSAPTVTPVRGKRTVAWWLSEPAPGSWWAVLRARKGESFEEVARLRAGQGQAMSWDDPGPPGAAYRYRIRRECMDRQYQWLSDEGSWSVHVPPGRLNGPALALYRASSSPAGAVARFELLNASAGPLDVQVYDLRGRMLLRLRPSAGGGGRDSFVIDLAAAASPTSGLYFLRVADASGRVSPSAKIVYLR